MAFVIGLTGGTGSGKSSLRPLFESLGYTYIDTDMLARKVVDPQLPYLDPIINVFGKDIYKGKILDRRLLAKKAFANPVCAAVLNLLTHPAIIEMSLDIIKDCGENGKAVVDAPLLFEAGMDSICDVVIAVTAPADKRTERIMKRDGISEEEAYKRIERQHSDEFYRTNADYIIVNDTDIASLESNTRNLLLKLAVR